MLTTEAQRHRERPNLFWFSLRLCVSVVILFSSFSLAQTPHVVNMEDFACTSDALAQSQGGKHPVLRDGSHTVDLAWAAPVPGSGFTITWYRVYRGTVNGGPYTLIADCVPSTSYSDATILNSQTYYYVSTAMETGKCGGVDCIVESSNSNQVTGAIPLQDAIGVALTRGVLPSESLTTSDTIARHVVQNRGLSESLTTGDALARQAAHFRSLAEALTTSDALSARIPGFTVNLAESLTTSDSLARGTIAHRALLETLTTGDSLAVPPPLSQLSWTGTSTATGTAIYSSGAGIIPNSLFGLHFRFNQNVQLSGQPCPTVVLKSPNIPFGALRLWDTDSRWQNLNPSAGSFTFTCLDPYLATALQRNVSEVIMVLSATPQWAASNPAVSTCDYSFYALGDCSPPSDLNADGTGTNQHWRDYIYALGTHLAGLSAALYKVPTEFEMWNEFTRGSGTNCTESSGTQAWLGTCEQLVRLAQDANCILTGRSFIITATAQTCTAGHMNVAAIGMLPTARIYTPNAVPIGADATLFGSYLSATGALLKVDEIAVHAYAAQGLGTTLPDSSSSVPNGASLVQQWANTLGVLPSSGAAFGLPILSTEGSWASTSSNMPDAQMQEGYVARYYLVGWSTGYRRLYWYAVNNSFGTLINQNGANGCNDHGTQLGCSTLAATGWTAVYNWMVGNEMNLPCEPDASGNLWTCGLLKNGTTRQLAVWDSSQGSAAAALTVTVPLSGTARVQATALNGAAPSGSNNWTTVPIPLGSYVAVAGQPGWGLLQVTGYATTSTTNDTLVLADPSHLVTAFPGFTSEVSSYSLYSPAPAWTKYYTLDSGSSSTSLSGTACGTPQNIFTAQRQSNVVKLVMRNFSGSTLPPTFASCTIAVSGGSDASFQGSFTVTSTVQTALPTEWFVFYSQTGADAGSTGGLLTPSGTVTTGSLPVGWKPLLLSQ